MEDLEHLSYNVEGIINGRLERVVRLAKIIEKASVDKTLAMHTEDLLHELNLLKHELKTLLNYMELKS